MRILKSYRWRRRLVITAIVVAVGVPGGFFAVKYSTGGQTNTAPEGGVVNVAPPEKHVPFTPAKRRKAREALRAFISTAVARRHVAQSWRWTGPGLRTGYTRKQWKTGDIPVEPFPVANKGLGKWEIVQYSYPKRVGLEVLIWPKAGSGQSSPLSVDVDLVPGPRGRWLVDYWLPRKYRAAPELAPKKEHKAKASAAPKAPRFHRAAPRAANEPHEQRSLSPLWWGLPLGLLSLIVLVPIGFAIVSWRRNRRAELEYLRTRS